jgi:hypothetical protein
MHRDIIYQVPSRWISWLFCNTECIQKFFRKIQCRTIQLKLNNTGCSWKYSWLERIYNTLSLYILILQRERNRKIFHWKIDYWAEQEMLIVLLSRARNANLKHKIRERLALIELVERNLMWMGSIFRFPQVDGRGWFSCLVLAWLVVGILLNYPLLFFCSFWCF